MKLWKHSWSSVIHHCPACGRLWRRNGDNNGWEKLPLPMHYVRLAKREAEETK